VVFLYAHVDRQMQHFLKMQQVMQQIFLLVLVDNLAVKTSVSTNSIC